jgi:hypothetical protein
LVGMPWLVELCYFESTPKLDCKIFFERQQKSVVIRVAGVATVAQRAVEILMAAMRREECPVEDEPIPPERGI